MGLGVAVTGGCFVGSAQARCLQSPSSCVVVLVLRPPHSGRRSGLFVASHIDGQITKSLALPENVLVYDCSITEVGDDDLLLQIIAKARGQLRHLCQVRLGLSDDGWHEQRSKILQEVPST